MAGQLFDVTDIQLIEQGLKSLEGDKSSKEYKAMVEAIRDVNRVVMALNEHGEYMTYRDRGFLVGMHKKALEKTEAYLDKLGYFKGKSEFGKRKREMAEMAKTVLDRNLAGFEKEVDLAGKKMDEALREMGAETRQVTLSSDTVGANSSNRGVVKDANGQVTGFFTPDDVVYGVIDMRQQQLERENASQLAAFDKKYGIGKISSKHGVGRGAMKPTMLQSEYDEISRQEKLWASQPHTAEEEAKHKQEKEERAKWEKERRDLFEHYQDNVQEGLYATVARKLSGQKTITDDDLRTALTNELGKHFDRKKVDKMLADSEFMDFSGDMIRKSWEIGKSEYGNGFLAGFGTGTHVARLNVAMSEVANMMGMPGLLAKSTMATATITEGGKTRTVSGVLMDKAVGEDMSKNAETGNFAGGFTMTGTAYRQISDMVLLDYVCGNVDRHRQNFMYKTEKGEDGITRITGIQGIDNDLSFGVDNTVMQDSSLIQTSALKYISEKAAVDILALDKDQMRMRLAGYLTPEQIDKTIERLENVQQEIRNGTFIALKDDEWDKAIASPEDMRDRSREGINQWNGDTRKTALTSISGVMRFRDKGEFADEFTTDPAKKAELMQQVEKAKALEAEKAEAAAKYRASLEASRKDRVYGCEVGAKELEQKHQIDKKKAAERKLHDQCATPVTKAELQKSADSVRDPESKFGSLERGEFYTVEYLTMKQKLSIHEQTLDGVANDGKRLDEAGMARLTKSTQEARDAISGYIRTFKGQILDADQTEKLHQLEELRDQLNKDCISYYRRGIDAGERRNERPAVEREISLAGKAVMSKGGGASTRLEIEGVGFFTEDSKYLTPIVGAQQAMERKALDYSFTPEQQALVSKWMNSFTIQMDDLTPKKSIMMHFADNTKGNTEEKAVRELLDYSLQEGGYSKAQIQKILEDKEFVAALGEIAKEGYKAVNAYEVSQMSGITEDLNIGDRNVAMSKVAKLLGSGDLLAESRRVTLKDGDITRTGVLMDTAVGTTKENLEEAPKLRMTDHAMKQISDMMFIDYICGNTDRHSGNITYILDGKDIIGIQGIDHDMSFGEKLNPENTSVFNPENCRAISSDMYDQLQKLDEKEFRDSLKGLLTDKEIDVAWQRAEYIRDKVMEKVAADEMLVLNEDEWTANIKDPMDMVATNEQGFMAGPKYAASSIREMLDVEAIEKEKAAEKAAAEKAAKERAEKEAEEKAAKEKEEKEKEAAEKTEKSAEKKSEEMSDTQADKKDMEWQQPQLPQKGERTMTAKATIGSHRSIDPERKKELAEKKAAWKVAHHGDKDTTKSFTMGSRSKEAGKGMSAGPK